MPARVCTGLHGSAGGGHFAGGSLSGMGSSANGVGAGKLATG
ncbi:MAG: hypothetical protein ACYDC6_00865 [Acidobacteriaceae bacterium]